MTEPDDDFSSGPTLSADGRLEQRFKAMEAPHEATPAAPEISIEAPAAVAPPAHVLPTAAARSKPRSLKIRVAASVAVGITAAIAFRMVTAPQREADGVRGSSLLHGWMARDAPTLVVKSVPSGALVIIEGERVGQTPWAGDNRWQDDVEIKLELTGHRTWVGRLQGLKAQSLEVQMKR